MFTTKEAILREIRACGGATFPQLISYVEEQATDLDNYGLKYRPVDIAAQVGIALTTLVAEHTLFIAYDGEDTYFDML